MVTTHTQTPAVSPPFGAGASRGQAPKERNPRPHYQETADLDFAERINRRRSPRKSTEKAIRAAQAALVALAVVTVLTTLPKAISQAAHDIAQHEKEED